MLHSLKLLLSVQEPYMIPVLYLIWFFPSRDFIRFSCVSLLIFYFLLREALPQTQCSQGCQVIYQKQFLHEKRIIVDQLNRFCIFQNHFVQFILKFLIFIIPEDDTSLIKLRQRCSKSAVQVLYYFICIQTALSPFRIFYINCASCRTFFNQITALYHIH